MDHGPLSVHVEQGEVYCPKCRLGMSGPFEDISLGSLRSLQYWLKDYPNKFEQADVKGSMEEELKRLFFRHLLHETAKPLKSYDFLHNIERLAHGPEGGDV
jgi:DNA repair protein RecO (recombination protein O)